MLALAAERTRGAHPYNVTPEHTARAREIVGPDAWLCVEQKSASPTRHRRPATSAAQTLAIYMPLTNYRNNWLSLGFDEDELGERGSDRFLDAMVAWGKPEAVRARIRAHFAAGASHVCIQPLDPAGSTAPDLNAVEALAAL